MKLSSLLQRSAMTGIIVVLSGCGSVNTTNQIVGTQPGATTGIITQPQNNQIRLSDMQIKKLQYLIEEEKLARDVYTTLYDKRNHKKFGNIINSEENHQELVQQILKKYDIADPTVGKNQGEYENQELSQLYLQLSQRGLISLSGAMNVGIEIETMDIKDIEEMMQEYNGYADIQDILQRLLDGSKRHLQAFSK